MELEDLSKQNINKYIFLGEDIDCDGYKLQYGKIYTIAIRYSIFYECKGLMYYELRFTPDGPFLGNVKKSTKQIDLIIGYTYHKLNLELFNNFKLLSTYRQDIINEII